MALPLHAENGALGLPPAVLDKVELDGVLARRRAARPEAVRPTVPGDPDGPDEPDRGAPRERERRLVWRAVLRSRRCCCRGCWGTPDGRADTGRALAALSRAHAPEPRPWRRLEADDDELGRRQEGRELERVGRVRVARVDRQGRGGEQRRRRLALRAGRRGLAGYCCWRRRRWRRVGVAAEDAEDVGRVDAEHAPERVVEGQAALVARDDGRVALSDKADVQDGRPAQVALLAARLDGRQRDRRDGPRRRLGRRRELVQVQVAHCVPDGNVRVVRRELEGRDRTGIGDCRDGGAKVSSARRSEAREREGEQRTQRFVAKPPLALAPEVPDADKAAAHADADEPAADHPRRPAEELAPGDAGGQLAERELCELCARLGRRRVERERDALEDRPLERVVLPCALRARAPLVVVRRPTAAAAAGAEVVARPTGNERRMQDRVDGRRRLGPRQLREVGRRARGVLGARREGRERVDGRGRRVPRVRAQSGDGRVWQGGRGARQSALGTSEECAQLGKRTKEGGSAELRRLAGRRERAGGRRRPWREVLSEAALGRREARRRAPLGRLAVVLRQGARVSSHPFHRKPALRERAKEGAAD